MIVAASRELPEPLASLPWEDFPQLRAVVEMWIEREILTPDEYAALADAFKQTAFSAARAWDEMARERLHSLLEKVLGDGLTAAEFKQLAGPVLDSPWYADLVYRNNVASAQAAGRYAVSFGEQTELYPYWRYLSIRDSRNDEPSECPNVRCRGLNGLVFRKDDADARWLLPPQHHQCRCDSSDVLADYTGPIASGRAMRARYPAVDGWDYDRVDSMVPTGLRKVANE